MSAHDKVRNGQKQETKLNIMCFQLCAYHTNRKKTGMRYIKMSWAMIPSFRIRSDFYFFYIYTFIYFSSFVQWMWIIGRKKMKVLKTNCSISI